MAKAKKRKLNQDAFDAIMVAIIETQKNKGRNAALEVLIKAINTFEMTDQEIEFLRSYTKGK